MPTGNSVSSLSLVPMTAQEAAALVTRMLGSYPSLNAHDPKTYFANLVTLLSGYPLWAGDRAVAQVKRQTKFPPTEADLYPALEDQVRVHRDQAEAQRRFQDTLRQLEGPREQKLTYEQLVEKYGPGFGIRNPDIAGRKPVFRSEDDLRAEYGQAFDDLPDAKDVNRWQKLKYRAEGERHETAST